MFLASITSVLCCFAHLVGQFNSIKSETTPEHNLLDHFVVMVIKIASTFTTKELGSRKALLGLLSLLLLFFLLGSFDSLIDLDLFFFFLLFFTFRFRTFCSVLLFFFGLLWRRWQLGGRSTIVIKIGLACLIPCDASVAKVGRPSSLLICQFLPELVFNRKVLDAPVAIPSLLGEAHSQGSRFGFVICFIPPDVQLLVDNIDAQEKGSTLLTQSEFRKGLGVKGNSLIFIPHRLRGVTHGSGCLLGSLGDIIVPLINKFWHCCYC
mmetsp:Transcript_4076/g.6822  ORF Transcript_4076/g.6822 Transcript_4076/m.6822 type:complete len:265 (+) Transcript_4076:429-1223(+)